MGSPCIPPDDALTLWRLGLWLLPLAPRTKVPNPSLLIGGKTKPLDKQRAQWRDVLMWQDHQPESNLGAFAGHGWVVLDIDRPELLPADLELNEDTAWINDTPGRVTEPNLQRRHIFYAWPDRVPRMKLPFGELIGNGYVVLPGSTHPDGGQYAWRDGHAPEDVPRLGPPPEWLRQALATGRWPTEITAPRAASTTYPTDNAITHPKTERTRNNTVTCSPLLAGVVPGDLVPRAKTESGRRWEAYAASPEVAVAVMRAMGADVRGIGKAFRCPLPGHGEGKPSAALYREPGRPYVLHDFHKRGPEWIPLADAWAAHVTGKLETLKPASRATWWLRCLADIGVIKLDVPKVTLPASAPASAQKVMDGYLHLLEIRKQYDPDQPKAAPFTWDFAAGWCGIKSKATVSLAEAWLMDNGWLTVKERGTAYTDKGKRTATVFELGPAALAALETVTITTAPEPITTQASPPAQLRPGHTMPSYKDNVLYLPSAGRLDAGRGWVDDARRARALH